jgi:hypothetical protein
MRSLRWLVSMFLLVMTLLVPVRSWAACTHYASPTGGGTGASAGSPFLVSQFWAVAGPGKTLCLVDGVYQGANSMIAPGINNLDGAPGNPIGIEAINDGGAVIDGQFTRVPLLLQGNSYWQVKGINFKNGQSTTGYIASWDSTDSSQGSNHNVFQRLVFWDANISTNSIVLSIDASYDNLLEDIAVFGTGGRMLQMGYGDYPSAGNPQNVCRRCWMRHEGVIGQTAVESLSLSYGGWMGGVCENCLMTRTMESMPENYFLTEQGVKQDPANGNCVIQDGYPAAPCPYPFTGYDWFFDAGILTATATGDGHSSTYGSLAYMLASYGPHDKPVDMLFHQNLNGAHEHLLMYATTSYTSTGGIYEYVDSTGTTQHVSSVRAAGGGTCNGGDCFAAGWTNTDFRAAATLAGLPTAAHPFTGTQGAQLCYQYQNKTLTSIPLWPWPMNDRIRAATSTAGNYFTNGGPGCGTNQGECTGILGHARVETDVTADVQAMLGTIPSICQGGAVTPPAPALTVLFNTVWGNTGTGLTIQTSATVAAVQDNILYGNSIANYTNNGTVTTEDHNVVTNPTFAAPGPPATFHVRGANVVKQGSLLAAVTVDYGNMPRTCPTPGTDCTTIGAYEDEGTPDVTQPLRYNATGLFFVQ